MGGKLDLDLKACGKEGWVGMSSVPATGRFRLIGYAKEGGRVEKEKRKEKEKSELSLLCDVSPGVRLHRCRYLRLTVQVQYSYLTPFSTPPSQPSPLLSSPQRSAVMILIALRLSVIPTAYNIAS